LIMNPAQMWKNAYTELATKAASCICDISWISAQQTNNFKINV
jgi:hypothetical protein